MLTPLGQKWLEAGRDLGFRVTAPFVLQIGEQSLLFDALVHDFGADHGMLLMETWGAAKAEAAFAQGYGYSCINSGTYERKSTIEVLRDWTWSRDEDSKPAWL